MELISLLSQDLDDVKLFPMLVLVRSSDEVAIKSKCFCLWPFFHVGDVKNIRVNILLDFLLVEERHGESMMVWL
jgi:hypothetical protein